MLTYTDINDLPAHIPSSGNFLMKSMNSTILENDNLLQYMITVNATAS